MSCGCERIGVLGGTFDPPHNGHLRIARCAREQLGLDRVLLVPVHTPPHKPVGEGAAGAEQRLEMVRLAAEGMEGVSECGIEVRRGGRSYTVDTLQEIQDAIPDARLTLIVGADMALTLGRWRRPERLRQLAGLAVAERGEADREQVLAALGPEVSFLRMEPLEVSSSLVRKRVRAGQEIGDLVPGRVADYIGEHSLYRPAEAERGAGGCRGERREVGGRGGERRGAGGRRGEKRGSG